MVKQIIVLLIIFNLLNSFHCKPTKDAPDSITRDLIVELPGNEKINKRSVDDSMISDEYDTVENYDNSQQDYESSENVGSSVEDSATDSLQIPLRLGRSTELAGDEMILLPFLSQNSNFGGGQRVVRSVDNTNNENSDGMEIAENGLVFRPLFRTKNNFRQRVARSIEGSNNIESQDEMETAENGMVFRPLFRTKSGFGIKQRVRRNIDPFKTDKYVDDMETAANGLVFRPVFRTSNRFAIGQRSRRSVNSDVSISPSAVNVINSNNLHSRRNLRTNRSAKQKEFLAEKSSPKVITKNMSFRS